MAELLTWFFSTIWPGVFVVLHGLIVVLASSHVVLTKRDSRAAIGWVGIIWLAPIIGTALYITFGVNRIQRKARLLRRGQMVSDLTAVQQAAADESLGRVLSDDAVHLASLVRYVSRSTHLPLLDGNLVRPLP